MGEQPFDPAEFGATSDDGGTDEASTSSSSSSGAGVLDRFLDGSRSGPPAGQVREDYQLPQWAAYIVRATIRVSPTDDLPPVGDAVLGLALGALELRGRVGGGGGGDSGDGGMVEMEFEGT